MSTVRKLISPQEYLAIERAAETRSEYLDGEMFAMAGASVRHILITANLARAIGNRLEDTPCLVLPTEMRVKVNLTGLCAYPDLAIVCDKLELEEGTVDILLNPGVIIEVLSDSTEKYDRGLKFQNYRRIPTLREFILVSQNRMFIERFTRLPDNSWNLQTFDDPNGVFPFATLAAQIPLQEIYRKVEFESDSNESRNDS